MYSFLAQVPFLLCAASLLISLSISQTSTYFRKSQGLLLNWYKKGLTKGKNYAIITLLRLRRGMMESKVKCSICQLTCTGREAGEHKTSTGHNDWELLMGERTMGREIKFRAMNYVSHTWWYGSNQVDRIDYGTNTMPIRTFWRWFVENALDPKTLGQYTGLKDKNGVEIYEGDVVQWNKPDGAMTEVRFGLWDNGNADEGGYEEGYGWYCIFEYVYHTRRGKQYKRNQIQSLHDQFVEVIGSIHSNPGLLKEEQ